MGLRSLFVRKKTEEQAPQSNTAVKQDIHRQEEQAMQPTTPATQEAEKPKEQAATTPAVEEPKKVTPEVKMLEIADEEATRPSSIRPENRPHAFVIMPFGKRRVATGPFMISMRFTRS